MESKWDIKENYIYCCNCGYPTRREVTPYCPRCGNIMTNYCDCYHIEYNVPVCWGTKEREQCSCMGLKDKCNFY